MGCGDAKEKIEDEMLKMKMERIELRMERYKQLELLKGIDGCDKKLPIIPDYIAKNNNNHFHPNKKASSSTLNKEGKYKRRSSKSKTCAVKGKVLQLNEEDVQTRNKKKRHTYKKKP